MKKTRKKGFTLVELLVIIGILSILAVVSVVGYLSFVKKAKVSNDVSLTTQMNIVLASNEVIDGKNETPYDAITELKEDGGFDVNKITPTADGYYYAYDSKENRMVLLDENMSVIAPSSYDISNHKREVFLFIDKESEINENCEYSYYLKDNFEESGDGIINFSTGLDVGENSISTLVYTNSVSDKEVKIRTDGGELDVGSSSLIAKGKIIHYGQLDAATVYTENNSFHTHGTVNYMDLKEGKIVAEKDGVIFLMKAESDTTAYEEDNGVIVVPQDAKINTSSSEDPITKSLVDLGYEFVEDSNEDETTYYFDSSSKTNKKMGNGIFENGDGSKEDPFQISTYEQWNYFYQIVYDWSGDEIPYFELINDIDLTNKNIKNYALKSDQTLSKGFFMQFDLNGNGYTLKGITYLKGYNLLFPYLYNSNIHDIIINYNINETRFFGMSYYGIGDLYFINVTTTGSIETTGSWATAFVCYAYKQYDNYNCNYYYTNCINKASIKSSFGTDGYAAAFGSHNGGGGHIYFDNCINYGSISGNFAGFVGMGNDTAYTFKDSNAVKNYGVMCATANAGYFRYDDASETKTIGNVVCNIKSGNALLRTIQSHENKLPENYGDEIEIAQVEGAVKYSIEFRFSVGMYNYNDSGLKNIWGGGFPRSISNVVTKEEIKDEKLYSGFYKTYICELKQESYRGHDSTTPTYDGIFAPSTYKNAELLTSNNYDISFYKDGDKKYCLYNDPDYPKWYTLLTTEAQNNPTTKGMTVTISIVAYDEANGVLSKATSSYSYTAQEARNYLGGN